MCTYVIYCEALRLPAIFSHFTCTAPLSTGYISTAEANLVSTCILKVCSVPFSFCGQLKGAVIRGTIQISDAPSNFPGPCEILPS